MTVTADNPWNRKLAEIQRAKLSDVSESTHALLLVGPQGVGKRDLAILFARWWMCLKPGTHWAVCETCVPCRRFKSETEIGAIDLRWIVADMEGTTNRIKVEALREIRDELGFSPLESRNKVVLLADAENLTPQAANALLKILEEPPARWVFVLTASDERRILPTILSRCQRMRVKPLKEDELRSLLQEHISGLSVDVSSGSLSVALRSAEPWAQEMRERFQRFLKTPELEFAAILDLVQKDASGVSNRLDYLLELHESALREAWLGTVRISESTLEKVTAFVAEARRMMETPVQKKLLAQTLLLSWTA